MVSLNNDPVSPSDNPKHESTGISKERELRVKKRSLNLLSIRQIVLFIWIATFIYLIWDDNYILFLKPSFGFLIYAGLIISILFAMASLFESHHSPRSETEILNALFILLPIIFIFSVGDNTLNSATLSKRTLTMPTIQDEPISLPIPDSADNGDGENRAVTAESGADDMAGSESDPIETSLSDLLRNWTNFSGKTVSLEGLFYNAVEEEQNNPMVFKYLITCCAADAMPVAIFLENLDITPYENDDWVKVIGEVNLRKRNGNQDAIYMTVRTINKVSKPSKTAAYIFF